MVWGAGRAVRGGVRGAASSTGGRGFSSRSSVRMGGSGGGSSATTTGAFREDRLPLRLLLLSTEAVDDARSRVELFFSLSPPKGILNRRPGDTPLFFALSDGTLSVEACRDEGREVSWSTVDSEAAPPLGPLTADSTSAWAPSVSVDAAEAKRGEEVV